MLLSCQMMWQRTKNPQKDGIKKSNSSLHEYYVKSCNSLKYLYPYNNTYDESY